MSKMLNRSPAWLLSAAAFGIAAQAGLLGNFTGAPARWAACTLALLGAAVVYLTARSSRSQPRPMLEMLLVTGSVGGLGMLVGSLLDARLAPPGSGAMPPCHAAMAPRALLATPRLGFGFELVPAMSWMNGLMLIACIGGCALLCSPQSNCQSGDYLRRCKTHGILSLGMLVGMPLGGRLGASLLGRVFGEAAGMHLAMLGGMLLGVAVVWPLTTLGLTRITQAKAVLD